MSIVGIGMVDGGDGGCVFEAVGCGGAVVIVIVAIIIIAIIPITIPITITIIITIIIITLLLLFLLLIEPSIILSFETGGVGLGRFGWS